MDTYNPSIRMHNFENSGSAMKQKTVQNVTSRKPFGDRALNCNTPNVSEAKQKEKLLGNFKTPVKTPAKYLSPQKLSPNCLSVCKSNPNVIKKASPSLNKKKETKLLHPSAQLNELDENIEDCDDSCSYQEENEIEDIFKFSAIWETADVMEFLKNYTRSETPPPMFDESEKNIRYETANLSEIKCENSFWLPMQNEFCEVDLPVY